jgi:hypothetical protein
MLGTTLGGKSGGFYLETIKRKPLSQASGSPWRSGNAARICIEFSDACFVRSRVRPWSVIDEIVREEFFENVEVSSPLELFGFAAHKGFWPSGRSDAAHLDTLREMLNPPTPSPFRHCYHAGCELLEQRGCIL